MVATVTLTGTLRKPDGTPHAGTVTITASVPKVVDAEGNVVFAGSVRLTLADGVFTVALPATDDPSLNPVGFAYTIRTRPEDGPGDVVTTELPAASPLVNLADVVDVAPGAPTYTERVAEATVSALEAAVSATAAADSAAESDARSVESTGSALSAAGSAVEADASADQAATSATAAAGSATAAQGSATDAAGSVQAVSDSATAADVSADQAAGSATAADVSADQAAGSATAAAGSATAAEGSASTAAAAVTTHEGKTDPHTQYAPKSNPLITGKVTTTGTTVRADIRSDLAANDKRWDTYLHPNGQYWVTAVDDGGTSQKIPLKLSRTGYVELDGAVSHRAGVGSPEGIVTAAVGSRYIDTSATSGAVEWIKASRTDPFGWKVVHGDTGNRLLTMNAGWSPISGTAFGPNLRRNGSTCTLGWYANLVDNTAYLTPLPPLDLGFRPAKRLVKPVFLMTAAPKYADFNSNGVIQCLGGTPANGTSTYVEWTYLTADPWPTILPGTAAA